MLVADYEGKIIWLDVGNNFIDHEMSLIEEMVNGQLFTQIKGLL